MEAIPIGDSMHGEVTLGSLAMMTKDLPPETPIKLSLSVTDAFGLTTATLVQIDYTTDPVELVLG